MGMWVWDFVNVSGGSSTFLAAPRVFLLRI
jgi:hypothetical protein